MNTKNPAELLPDPAAVKALKLLWLSCGNMDDLLRVSQGVHTCLKERGVPHVWHSTDHAHDAPERKQALYHFVQKLTFEPTTPRRSAPGSIGEKPAAGRGKP